MYTLEFEYDKHFLNKIFLSILKYGKVPDFFVPNTLDYDQKKIRSYYNVKYFTPIGESNYSGSLQLITFFINLLETVINAENYFFYHDNYIIDERTVFVDLKFADVKILFLPKPFTSDNSFDLIIKYFERTCSNEDVKVMEIVKSVLNDDYHKLKLAVYKLKKIKNEIDMISK